MFMFWNSEHYMLYFQLICSYVFWPVAFLMGCDSEDARRVAAMIGTKTFLNEFVAYAGMIYTFLNEFVAYAGMIYTFLNEFVAYAGMI